MRTYPPMILDAGLPFPGAAAPLPIIYEPAEPSRWQYRVVTIDPREDEPLDEEALATIGADGWLLAGILPQPAHGQEIRVYYYFVRPAA
jgi:hypothetical protein